MIDCSPIKGDPFTALIVHTGIVGLRTIIVYNPQNGNYEAVECTTKDVYQIPLSSVVDTHMVEKVTLKY